MNYISDQLSSKDIEKWKNGNTILIDAQTGQGKSTFIMNILRQYAKDNNKTILFLSNRNALKEQNKKLLGIENNSNNDGVITVKNYQSLENSIKRGKPILDYDYIVCDEAHYFFTDSKFNQYTDMLLYYCFHNTKAVMIHMSGTPDTIKYYYNYKGIKLKRKIYCKRDYSYIDKVYMYNNNDNIVKMISQFEPNEKAIVFTTIKNVMDWHEIFKSNSDIFVGTSSDFYELVKEEIKESITNESRFDNQLLFTTNGLDCGVNIKDTNIKHIIIDYMDLDILLQCLGRLRPIDNQTINVYIKNRFGNMLEKAINDSTMIITKCDYLMTHGANEYLKNYSDEREHYKKYGIYPLSRQNKQTLEYNEAKYIKAKYDLELYNLFIDKYDGYMKHIVKKLFKRKVDDYMNLDELFNDYDINRLFEEIGINVKLFEEQQKQIKDYFLANVLSFKDSSISNFNVRTINGYLDDNRDKYSYRIETGICKGSRSDTNRDNRYWKIVRL